MNYIGEYINDTAHDLLRQHEGRRVEPAEAGEMLVRSHWAGSQVPDPNEALDRFYNKMFLVVDVTDTEVSILYNHDGRYSLRAVDAASFVSWVTQELSSHPGLRQLKLRALCRRLRQEFKAYAALPE